MTAEAEIIIAIDQLRQKLDEVISNQGVTIKMLETIIESMPSTNNNMAAVKGMLKPVLDNPMFKNNPAFKGIVDSLDAFGGD